MAASMAASMARGDQLAYPGMADPETQAGKPGVAEMGDDVADPVMPAGSATALQAHRIRPAPTKIRSPRHRPHRSRPARSARC